MHFSGTLSVLLASATACHAAFRPGCEDASWDSDTDYFLDKFDPKDEKLPIAPTYNKTYVAIRNRQRRHVVLHCTNTPPPRSIVGEEALMVKVPVTSVAELDGFSQTVIEVRHVYTREMQGWHANSSYLDARHVLDYQAHRSVLRCHKLLHPRQHDE